MVTLPGLGDQDAGWPHGLEWRGCLGFWVDTGLLNGYLKLGMIMAVAFSVVGREDDEQMGFLNFLIQAIAPRLFLQEWRVFVSRSVLPEMWH